MCHSNPAAGIIDDKSVSRGEQCVERRGEKHIIERMDEQVNGSSSKADVLSWNGARWTEMEACGTSTETVAKGERLDVDNSSWLAQYLEGITETQPQDYSNSGEDSQSQEEQRSFDQSGQEAEKGGDLVDAPLPSAHLSLDSFLDTLDQFVEIEMNVEGGVEPLFDVIEQQGMPNTCTDLIVT